MGRRARAKGVVNAALRAGARELSARDSKAQEIADATYVAVRTWREVEGPLLLAPVQVAASMAAPAIAMHLELPVTDVPDIVAFLTDGFYEAIGAVDPAALEAWRVRDRELNPH